MAYAIVASKTFFLKTKLSCYCWDCEKKLKNFLHKIRGVHSVSFDPKEEKLTISGTVFPEKIIQELAKNHVRAEFFVEEVPKQNKPEKNNKQIVLSSQPRSSTGKEIMHNLHDHDIAKDLELLSSLKGVKHVELIYSTTTKYSGISKEEETQESHVRKIMLITNELEGDQRPQKTVDLGGSSKFHGDRSSDRNGKWIPLEQAPPWQPPRDFQPYPVHDSYQPSAPLWQPVYEQPCVLSACDCHVRIKFAI